MPGRAPRKMKMHSVLALDHNPALWRGPADCDPRGAGPIFEVAQRLDWERVRLLPPEYNYPLNLLGDMPPHLRPPTLNRLVNAVYEDAFPWGQIEIREPLRAWLAARIPGAEGE